ncbi:MAG TPA: hypothetical protein VI077_04915, partial [Pseudolabrys sp.]
VVIKVDDLAPNGYATDRATVRQRKTGRPVRFELTEQTRQAVDDYLKGSRKKAGEFFFTSPQSGRSMTPRQYGRPCRIGSSVSGSTRICTVRTHCRYWH